MVSCFGDNAAASENPDLVPVDERGEPATRDRDYFDWAYICPTHPEYREGLLEIIEDCATENDDVRLDDVGFPREGSVAVTVASDCSPRATARTGATGEQT